MTPCSLFTIIFILGKNYSYHILNCQLDSLLFIVSGEFKSVYVRNLSSTVTAAEIEEEFKNFGRIKPDGVFIRNRKVIFSFNHAHVFKS